MRSLFKRVAACENAAATFASHIGHTVADNSSYNNVTTVTIASVCRNPNTIQSIVGIIDHIHAFALGGRNTTTCPGGRFAARIAGKHNGSVGGGQSTNKCVCRPVAATSHLDRQRGCRAGATDLRIVSGAHADDAFEANAQCASKKVGYFT